MMTRPLLAAVCLIACPFAALAEPPVVKRPYHLQIVCHFARNRGISTPYLVKVVPSEIRDDVRIRLGAMARVELVERESRHRAALAQRGLKAVLAQDGLGVLDSWHQVSDTKIHYVLIDFPNGRIRIRTRQYDGLTGLASPRTRVAYLQDPAERRLLGQRAAEMILADFGLVGLVDPDDPGPEVDVTIRGLGLTSTPDQWIHAGDVFAVSNVYKSNGRLEGRREPWALLQVLGSARDGVCRCRYSHRFAWSSLGQPGIEVRFLKLDTTTAHLHLRLIDEKARTGIVGQAVTVSRDGFGPNPDERLSTNNDGMVESKQEYGHVAFVEVQSAGKAVATVPVPILGGDLVECPIHSLTLDNARGDVEMQKQLWLGQINETRTVARRLFDDLQQLLKTRSNADALARADSGLQDLKAAIARHQAALKHLQESAHRAGLDEAAQLLPGEARALQELTEWKTALESAIQDLRGTVQKEKDPAIAVALRKIQQAKLLERTADYEKALALYDEALRALPEGGDKPKLQSHVDKLRGQWTIQSKEQGEARKFAYEVWPKLTTAKDIIANLPTAQKTLAICKKLSDRLTLNKLWLASAAQTGVVAKETDALSTVQGDDAEKKKKELMKLSTDLEAFYKELAAELSK